MDLSQLFQKDASKIHAGSKVNNAKPFLCKRDVISLIGKSAKDVHSDYSLDALLFALRLSMGEGQTLFRYPCWLNQISTDIVAVVDKVLQLNTIRSMQLLY